MHIVLKNKVTTWAFCYAPCQPSRTNDISQCAEYTAYAPEYGDKAKRKQQSTFLRGTTSFTCCTPAHTQSCRKQWTRPSDCTRNRNALRIRTGRAAICDIIVHRDSARKCKLFSPSRERTTVRLTRPVFPCFFRLFNKLLPSPIPGGSHGRAPVYPHRRCGMRVSAGPARRFHLLRDRYRFIRRRDVRI